MHEDTGRTSRRGPQPNRIKDRRLADNRLAVLAGDLELEPCAARQLISPGVAASDRLERFDPPEVYGISHAKIDRVASARRNPTPPTSKSSRPRICHSQFP